jgi:outer membrane protein assembly factor BamE (lipoprotein component of BamABCDE complex)
MATTRGAMMVMLVLAAALLVGCGGQLTRQNYEKVYVGQPADEVRDLLGWPDTTVGGDWLYLGQHPYRRAKIMFTDGKVSAKDWSDGQESLGPDPFGQD